MSDKPRNEYFKSKIMTATPAQLQTMLYDGAIRFCEQARQAMTEKDIPATHDKLIRAQRIVLELSSSMKVELNPELCGKLASLYNYVYRLLIDANLNKDIAKVEEAVDLLRYQRETWLMALEKLREEHAPIAADTQQPAQSVPEPGQPAPRPAGSPGPLVGGALSIEG